MSTPTIDPRWRDGFVVALRMRDVPSDRIADQLKLVETHCAESGESAQEAFGEPVDYADSIAPSPPLQSWDLARVLPPAVVGLLAGRLVVDGAVGLVQGEPVEVTTGSLAAGAVLVASAVLVVTVISRRRRPLVPAVICVATVAAAVLLDVGLTAHVMDLPAGFALATAVVIFAAFGLWLARRARRDRIADPVTGESML